MDIYETHVMKDSLLPFIFHRRHLTSRRTPEPNNWHENVEVLYFLEGDGTMVCDGESFSVGAGDVVAVGANVLHATHPATDLRFAVLILDRAFCLANGIDTNALEFDRLIRDGEIRAHMDALIREYASPDKPHRVPMIRAEALLILSLLCRRYSRPLHEDTADSRIRACIRQAVGLLRSEYASDLSLDGVAARVGLSKYYFAREFRRVTGYTFISYLNLIRCQQARRLLLQTEDSVADVGRACGFSSPSYFTRTFRAIIGKTPHEIRK